MNLESEERLAFDALKAEDNDRAYQLFTSLAEKGSIRALNALGWMHETGAAGTASKLEAIFYYRKAAEAGVGEAYYNLGTLLLESADETEALEAFEKGADLGDLRSMCELGSMLVRTGKGTPDEKKGVMLLKRAAAEGHFFAQRRLLSIELDQNRTILNRIRFVGKVSVLAWRGLVLHLKDSTSRRL